MYKTFPASKRETFRQCTSIVHADDRAARADAGRGAARFRVLNMMPAAYHSANKDRKRRADVIERETLP